MCRFSHTLSHVNPITPRNTPKGQNMRLRSSFAAATLFMASLALSPVPAMSQELSRGDVETIIREYLLANPEVLEEAFTELQRKREAEAEIERMASLVAVREELEQSELDPVIGNPDGTVTMVEFFDYNCGFCRQAHADLDRLIQENPNLRVVMKEFPVLGRGSMEAASVSIAVNQVAPEAYEEFHAMLLNHEGAADETSALAIAQQLGLPVEEIQEIQRSPVVRETVESSYEIAQALGLSGTPSYVIGDTVEFGAVGYDRLQTAINLATCGAILCE